MATYVYQCGHTECSKEFEAEHPITAPAGADCPVCGRRTERRLIARTSFALKGGGWFKTGGY